MLPVMFSSACLPARLPACLHCRVGETLIEAVVGSSEAQMTYADIVRSSLKDTGGVASAPAAPLASCAAG